MPKLSRRVMEWQAEIGITPEQISKYLGFQSNAVRQIVEKEFTKVIDGDLAEFAGQAGSLKTYKPKSTKVRQTHNETGIEYDTYDITVESPEHQRIRVGKKNLPLNVFNLIDSGRKRLKGLRGKKRYLLWSWTGADSALTVPVKNKGRGIRNTLTGKFGYTQPNRDSVTPIRPEPRTEKGPRLSKKQRGGQFFAKGPLKAVPARDLYERIYQNAKKQIRRRKLIVDIVLVKGKK